MCRYSIKRVSKNDPLRETKLFAVRAAKDLGYLPVTINEIIRATTKNQVSRILATARPIEIGTWRY
jgi:hypothetical protein